MHKRRRMKTAIKCPGCNRIVLTVDSKTTTTLSSKCEKCRKLVSYNGETKEIRLLKNPERYSSSGVRFW